MSAAALAATEHSAATQQVGPALVALPVQLGTGPAQPTIRPLQLASPIAPNLTTGDGRVARHHPRRRKRSLGGHQEAQLSRGARCRRTGGAWWRPARAFATCPGFRDACCGRVDLLLHVNVLNEEGREWEEHNSLCEPARQQSKARLGGRMPLPAVPPASAYSSCSVLAAVSQFLSLFPSSHHKRSTPPPEVASKQDGRRPLWRLGEPTVGAAPRTRLSPPASAHGGLRLTGRVPASPEQRTVCAESSPVAARCRRRRSAPAAQQLPLR